MMDCVQKSICNLPLREIRCLTPIFDVVVCIETCERVLKTPLEIFTESQLTISAATKTLGVCSLLSDPNENQVLISNCFRKLVLYFTVIVS